jgi:hypothetical protein
MFPKSLAFQPPRDPEENWKMIVGVLREDDGTGVIVLACGHRFSGVISGEVLPGNQMECTECKKLVP